MFEIIHICRRELVFGIPFSLVFGACLAWGVDQATEVGHQYLQWRMPTVKKKIFLSSLSDLLQVPNAFGSIVCLQMKWNSKKTKTYPIHKHTIITSMPSGPPSG